MLGLDTHVLLHALSGDLTRKETALLSRLHVWPITWEICRTISKLDFRGDPADEIIAATSIVQRVPLVTRDRVIRRSKLVPLARTP